MLAQQVTRVVLSQVLTWCNEKLQFAEFSRQKQKHLKTSVGQSVQSGHSKIGNRV